ncbi:MAG TPA: hypothetical protein VMA36_20790 [Candidatus Limnocylindria bacterium]|jgi:hypothetical protein|nr:hypothetical protein [Candidatus Limnocylindria bacterium]
MTIIATHFSLVLGAWRLRVRIDLDEPRDEPARRVARASRYASRARVPHLHRRIS